VLELAVLGLLKEQPLHGYELKKRLGDTLGVLWGVSYGSLYPALRRLEKAGAIQSVSGAAAATVLAPVVPTGSITGDVAAAKIRSVADRVAGGRRTRKAYRITERGEAMLVELLLAPSDRPGADSADDEKAFVLRLAFCRHVPSEARLVLLTRRRDVLQSRLDRVQRGDTSTVVSQDRYTRSLLEHRTQTTKRDLEWVEGLIVQEQDDQSHASPETAPAQPIHRDIQEGARA
jgi:DNA-binding PadR family transcriptional regulator